LPVWFRSLVSSLQDVHKILGDEKFEAEITTIPGHGSGDSGTGKACDLLACKGIPMLKLFRSHD